MQEQRKQTAVEHLLDFLQTSTRTGINQEQSFINIAETPYYLSFQRTNQQFPAPQTNIGWKERGNTKKAVAIDQAEFCKLLDQWAKIRYVESQSIVAEEKAFKKREEKRQDQKDAEDSENDSVGENDIEIEGN